MIKCEDCKRKFPDHLISPLTIGRDGASTSKYCCPICALKLTNEIHGINETEFQGEIAQSMLVEAKQFLKGKNK